MALSRKHTCIGNALLEPPTSDWDRLVLLGITRLREDYFIPQNMQDGNNSNLKTAGPNEPNHITRIPANQVSFPDESHCRKGNMEKKDDIIHDDYEQTQVMLVEENQNSADDEDLVIDVLTNFKELASHSTPVSGTHNAPLGKASESKACKTKCKKERSSSRNEALDNSIAKSPKHEVGSMEASTSKQGRRRFLKKSSRAYRLVREFGHMLMKYDIRVWWPEEQMFFKGTIADFDHKTNRHMINYVDGDVEMLDLTEECWHFADIENLNPILELETFEGPPPPLKRGGSKKKGKGKEKKQRH